MTKDTYKTDLSVRSKALVERMQQINFGRIENLPILAGEPVPDERTKTIRKVKFGGQNIPRKESEMSDFKLKVEVVEFFDELERIGDGIIHSLEIKHGLPFAMDVQHIGRADEI